MLFDPSKRLTVDDIYLNENGGYNHVGCDVGMQHYTFMDGFVCPKCKRVIAVSKLREMNNLLRAWEVFAAVYSRLSSSFSIKQ